MKIELGVEKAIKEKVRSKFSLFDITFSYYCHLGCAHCMYDCTPQRQKSTMKKENIFMDALKNPFYLDTNLI